jgi:hypothetical protein
MTERSLRLLRMTEEKKNIQHDREKVEVVGD